MADFRRRKKRLMAEINVVPYIDVMLVLLVIFMVTAPLLTQGVKVELPDADAESLPSDTDNENFIVTVDRQGLVYINEDTEPSDLDRVRASAAAVLKNSPDTPFYVKGDSGVSYEKVIQAMVALQQGGVGGVGLITENSVAN